MSSSVSVLRTRPFTACLRNTSAISSGSDGIESTHMQTSSMVQAMSGNFGVQSVLSSADVGLPDNVCLSMFFCPDVGLRGNVCLLFGEKERGRCACKGDCGCCIGKECDCCC